MWLLDVEIQLFCAWPLLIALALWLGWKLSGRAVWKKLSVGMFVAEVLWLVIIAIIGFTSR